jgi:uncharacterized membrane protein YiaA
MPTSATLNIIPPPWAASLRSPHLLWTFFGVGLAAYVCGFVLMMTLRLNDYGFALVVLVVTLVGIAAWTRNLRPRFFAVGLAVGLSGLVIGSILVHLLFFAFHPDAAL